MSTIKNVSMPHEVVFGERFAVTVDFEAVSSKTIAITPQGSFSVDPETIDIDGVPSPVSVQLRVVDEEVPSAKRTIQLKFQLGASRFFDGTLAKLK